MCGRGDDLHRAPPGRVRPGATPAPAVSGCRPRSRRRGSRLITTLPPGRARAGTRTLSGVLVGSSNSASVSVVVVPKGPAARPRARSRAGSRTRARCFREPVLAGPLARLLRHLKLLAGDLEVGGPARWNVLAEDHQAGSNTCKQVRGRCVGGSARRVGVGVGGQAASSSVLWGVVVPGRDRTAGRCCRSACRPGRRSHGFAQPVTRCTAPSARCPG